MATAGAGKFLCYLFTSLFVFLFGVLDLNAFLALSIADLRSRRRGGQGGRRGDRDDAEVLGDEGSEVAEK